MFKFVAAIFLVVNGTPSDEPIAVLPYKLKTFETVELCMEFPKTDAGKVAMAVIDVGDKPLVVRFACVKAEDNSI